MAKEKRATVGREVIQGAKEVLAALKGDKTAGRKHVVPSVDVAEVRRCLKLSQAEFAAAFGLSLDSVKNWEQGHRSPEGPAKVLLAVIAKDPQAVQNALAGYRCGEGADRICEQGATCCIIEFCGFRRFLAWMCPPYEPHSEHPRRIVMYAVIETGGKQYRVAPGDVVRVETLPGDVGAEVELGRVLAVVNDSNELTAGSGVSDARVKGTISGHGRGDKVIVFKFKRKKQYKRTIGHRQNYTEVKVSEILA
jgi:large subunit ribosomal protein L21